MYELLCGDGEILMIHYKQTKSLLSFGSAGSIARFRVVRKAGHENMDSPLERVPLMFATKIYYNPRDCFSSFVLSILTWRNNRIGSYEVFSFRWYTRSSSWIRSRLSRLYDRDSGSSILKPRQFCFFVSAPPGSCEWSLMIISNHPMPSVTNSTAYSTAQPSAVQAIACTSSKQYAKLGLSVSRAGIEQKSGVILYSIIMWREDDGVWFGETLSNVCKNCLKNIGKNRTREVEFGETRQHGWEVLWPCGVPR